MFIYHTKGGIMKLIVYVVRVSLLLALACVLFGVAMPELYGSVYPALVVSAAALNIVTRVVAWVIVVVAGVMGGVTGMAVFKSKVKGASVGALAFTTLFLPAIYTGQACVMTRLPEVLPVFPKFSIMQSIALLIIIVMTTDKDAKNKEEK